MAEQKRLVHNAKRTFVKTTNSSTKHLGDSGVIWWRNRPRKPALQFRRQLASLTRSDPIQQNQPNKTKSPRNLSTLFRGYIYFLLQYQLQSTNQPDTQKRLRSELIKNTHNKASFSLWSESNGLLFVCRSSFVGELILQWTQQSNQLLFIAY